MNTLELKECSVCHEWKPLSSFRENWTYSPKKFGYDIVAKDYRHSVCKNCESKARSKKKWDAKASNAIGNEAKKWGFTVEQLNEWGVTTNFVKSLFLDAWSHVDEKGVYSCVHCRQVNHICNNRNADGTIIPLTPSDLSLDITDKERVKRTGKITCSNLRVICQTANRAKGSKDSTKYDIEVQGTYRDELAIKKGVQFSLQETTHNLNSPLQPQLF